MQEGHVNNLRKPLKELLLEPRYIQARSFRIDYAYFKNLVCRVDVPAICQFIISSRHFLDSILIRTIYNELNNKQYHVDHDK